MRVMPRRNAAGAGIGAMGRRDRVRRDRVRSGLGAATPRPSADRAGSPTRPEPPCRPRHLVHRARSAAPHAANAASSRRLSTTTMRPTQRRPTESEDGRRGASRGSERRVGAECDRGEGYYRHHERQRGRSRIPGQCQADGHADRSEGSRGRGDAPRASSLETTNSTSFHPASLQVGDSPASGPSVRRRNPAVTPDGRDCSPVEFATTPIPRDTHARSTTYALA